MSARGYEADLLTALEAMEGANLTFDRRGIGAWDNIWLLPAEPPYDLVGGGITILESRTRDAAGRRVVVFTAGHIGFRQSLLVRAADASRLGRHRDLTGADRVGVLAGTTGEARLLELTGITGADGVLAAGTRVETAMGEVVADGTGGYAITAAGATAGLAGRTHLQPSRADQPPVVYLPDEAALLQALAAGEIDAVARGEAGNLVAARSAEGAFVVTALDARVETGGFALAAADAELAACLDRHLAHRRRAHRLPAVARRSRDLPATSADVVCPGMSARQRCARTAAAVAPLSAPPRSERVTTRRLPAVDEAPAHPRIPGLPFRTPEEEWCPCSRPPRSKPGKGVST